MVELPKKKKKELVDLKPQKGFSLVLFFIVIPAHPAVLLEVSL